MLEAIWLNEKNSIQSLFFSKVIEDWIYDFSIYFNGILNDQPIIKHSHPEINMKIKSGGAWQGRKVFPILILT